MKLKPYTTAPILAVLVFLMILCAERILAGLDMDIELYLLTCGAVQAAAYFLPLALYGLLFGNISIKRMRFSLPTAVSVPSQILLAVILLLGSALVSMLSIRLGFASAGDTVSLGIGAPSISLLIVFAVVPAICEEIVFRGVIMSSFEGCGISPAVIGTSLLFAFAHMSIERFPVYFFSSVVLCFVVYVSRSIIAAIVIHSVYNIAALTMGDYLSGVASHLESFSLLFIVMLFLLWIFAVVALTEISRVYRSYAEKGLDSKYVPSKMTKAQKLRASASVYFSFPFLLAVMIYIAIVVFSMQEVI